MRTLLPLFVVALFTGVSAEGQAVRFDSQVYTTQTNCVAGKLCPVLAVPGSTIAVCSPPGCASQATTYTDFTAMVQCSPFGQVTPAQGGTCRSTGTAQGDFGFWILPGQYTYTVKYPTGELFGPFPISIGASAGCILGVTCDANYQTLAAACTAAGAGTLVITRVWGAVPSQSLACGVVFYGNGKIQPNSGATVTFAGTVTCPTYQRCFDSTTNSGAAITFVNPPSNVNPVQWGADPSGSANSQAATQAAINAVPGKTLNVFPGSYLLSGSGSQLILNSACASMQFVPGASFLTATGVGSGTDVMRVAGPCSGLVLNNYTATSQSGTPARYGLNLDATNGPVSNFRISHPMITSQFGSGGIVTTFPSGTDGIFDGVIDGFGVVRGGINLEKVGDNVAIRDLNMPGNGPGFWVNMVSGAGNLVIEHNSISTCSGSVYVISGLNVTVQNNLLEPASGCARPANDALIDFDGTSGAPLLGMKTQGNQINGQPGTTTYLIRANYAAGAHFAFDEFNLGDITQFGVLATTHAINTKVLDPDFPGTNHSHILVDQGTSALAEYVEAATIKMGKNVEVSDNQGTHDVNLTVKCNAAQTAVPFGLMNSAGNALLSTSCNGSITFPYSVANSIFPSLNVFDSAGSTRQILLADPGADFISFGYLTAPATGGGLSFFSKGLESFRISPNGPVMFQSRARPTSCSGLPTGTLWNNGGVANFCP